jgi:hypothetical protein
MNPRALLPVLALLASACTVTPQNGGVDTAFNPPLVSRQWRTENYTLPNGIGVCAISSGYNGLTVSISHPPAGEDVAIQSNRLMQPGATLTVNAGGGSFEAYDSFFKPQAARALLENLARGGKAYLEWSEFSGPSGRERVHVQNVVQLDNFVADLKACRNSLR